MKPPQTAQARPVLGGVIFGLSGLAMGAALVLWVGWTDEPFTVDVVLFPTAYLAFGAVGALIVARQPRNVIGRLALLTGLAGALVALADSIAASLTVRLRDEVDQARLLDEVTGVAEETLRPASMGIWLRRA